MAIDSDFVPKKPFRDEEIPPFADAPPAVLIVGDVDFFVDEAAARVREILGGGDAEVLRFEDDAPAEAISDALLNRSLFSPRRIVELDVSRLLGTESPGSLVAQALEAWDEGSPGGRRKAFRFARAVLAALDLPASADPGENAEAVCRRVRRKDDAARFSEILEELPQEKSGGPAVLKAALRVLLEREKNDGTVALLTAVSPPAGVDLLQEIAEKGTVLEASVGKDAPAALRRLAAALAKEREVVLDPAAVERLLVRTDAEPGAFATELRKLLAWAGKGGRIRAADVESNIEDESSEDVYGLFEAIGRRDAGDALARLERLFDGRDVRQGDRELKKIEEIWQIQLFGIIAGEVRRMLLIQARLEETGKGVGPSMSYGEFQARVLPSLMAPAAPSGRSPFQGSKTPVHPFALYKAAQRASRYTSRELARALSAAADVDIRLKSSPSHLETLSLYVGRLIAGG